MLDLCNVADAYSENRASSGVGDAADLEGLTKIIGSPWDAEFATTASKVVNEVKTEEENNEVNEVHVNKEEC